jgi:glycosyltransferase involved in cell wall biosynthesis
MSATRNLGLAHASGEMIAFLDGDDVWVPEKLTRQVELLQSRHRHAARSQSGRWWRWTESGHVVSELQLLLPCHIFRHLTVAQLTRLQQLAFPAAARANLAPATRASF